MKDTARSLSKYKLYVKYIQLYAKAIHMRLEFSAYDGDGAYVPSRRLIRVDPELSEAATIAVLLHELGHVLDDTLMSKKRFREVERAYKNLDTPRYKKHKKAILRTERRAWEYGRVIAKILGIPLGKWYDKARDCRIKAYKEG